ncbi:MAG: biopolymer transporter ExbD [Lentisphaerae bacterium]|nr:biopolymer transporter ExbD [Lentisphaerota bacterium]
MPRHKRAKSEGSQVDMTPMIDVVFQLIIFFIVTIKMDQEINEDIRLAKAEHGPVIENEDPRTMVVEINKKGWISIHGAQLSRSKFTNIMAARKRRLGQFPVLIRGDLRAEHKDIRAVMDICAQMGIWRLNFAAIKQEATNK